MIEASFLLQRIYSDVPDKMSKRQKVQYSGMGGEPAFLAAFKKKVGYQEPEEDVDMEAKKAKLMKDFDERELDDEVLTRKMLSINSF